MIRILWLSTGEQLFVLEKNARATFVENHGKEFHTSEPLTVHWNGKLFKDSTSNKHVNCLSTLIPRLSVHRKLADSKITAGKGETQGQAVIYALEE